jgi:hypothetical protein
MNLEKRKKNRLRTLPTFKRFLRMRREASGLLHHPSLCGSERKKWKEKIIL